MVEPRLPTRRQRKPVVRRARKGRWIVALTCLSLALIGCASSSGRLSQAPWKIEPRYATRDGIDAPSAAGFYSLGIAYQGEGRWRLAADAYAKAAAHDPSNPDHWSALGVALGAIGNFAASIEAFDRALRIAPDRAQLMNNMGFALMLDSQFERAGVYLRAAIARDPAHQRARDNLETVETQIALAASERDASVAARRARDSRQGEAGGGKRPAPLEFLTAGAPLEVMGGSDFELRRRAAASAPDPAIPDSAAAGSRGAAARELPVTVAGRRVRFEISNGNGVTGAAARMRRALFDDGTVRSATRLTDSRPFDRPVTEVQYAEGYREVALALSDRLPHTSELTSLHGSARSDVRVLLGHDLRAVPVPSSRDARSH